MMNIDDLKTKVGELVGSATVCWEPRPEGVFDSTAAAGYLEQIYDLITDYALQQYEDGYDCGYERGTESNYGEYDNGYESGYAAGLYDGSDQL